MKVKKGYKPVAVPDEAHYKIKRLAFSLGVPLGHVVAALAAHMYDGSDAKDVNRKIMLWRPTPNSDAA